MGRENGQDRRVRRQRRKEKAERAEQKKAQAASRHSKRPEDDDAALDALLDQFRQLDTAQSKFTESVVDAPSPRAAAVLVTAPVAIHGDEPIILYGGEADTGRAHKTYGDMYLYFPKKAEWRKWGAPPSPPPRSGHQAVALPRNGGEIWVFGGECSSPNGSISRHYGDLWVFHLTDKRWEEVRVPGGPSSRSGHRMVAYKKNLVVFGGYHDTGKKKPKYYNDVYVFDLENYRWQALEFPPIVLRPEPRSACQMVASSDAVYIVGGYSITPVKADNYKGQTHTDGWELAGQPDDEAAAAYAKFLEQTPAGSGAGGASGAAGAGAAASAATGGATKGPAAVKSPPQCAAGLKWTWSRMRMSGAQPGSRCGASAALRPGNLMVSFGGVCDVETEESLQGEFFNDLHVLNLAKSSWQEVEVKGVKEVAAAPIKPPPSTSRRRKNRQDLPSADDPIASAAATISVGGAAAAAAAAAEKLPSKSKTGGGKEDDEDEDSDTSGSESEDEAGHKASAGTANAGSAATSAAAAAAAAAAASAPSAPTPRMSAAVCMRGHTLYLYGGLVEIGDRQITFGDLYQLDMSKMQQWQVLLPMSAKTQQWLEESSSSEDEESDEDESDEDEKAAKGAKGGKAKGKGKP